MVDVEIPSADEIRKKLQESLDKEVTPVLRDVVNKLKQTEADKWPIEQPVSSYSHSAQEYLKNTLVEKGYSCDIKDNKLYIEKPALKS